MAKISVKNAALSVGIFAAVLHFIGVILIVLTNGQLLNWKLSLHFIFIDFTMLSFNWLTFVLGIILAFVIGYVVGGLFALIWNKVQK